MAYHGIPRPDLPAEKLADLVRKRQIRDGDAYNPLTHAIQLNIPYEIFLARLEVARQMAERKSKSASLIEFSL